MVSITGDLLQDFNLVIGSFQIVGRAFHDFDSDIVLKFEIFRQPDGWKVSPAEFLNKNISIRQHFSHMAGMVATDFVVFDALILTMVFVVELHDEIIQGAWLEI